MHTAGDGRARREGEGLVTLSFRPINARYMRVIVLPFFRRLARILTHRSRSYWPFWLQCHRETWPIRWPMPSFRNHWWLRLGCCTRYLPNRWVAVASTAASLRLSPPLSTPFQPPVTPPVVPPLHLEAGTPFAPPISPPITYEGRTPRPLECQQGGPPRGGPGSVGCRSRHGSQGHGVW